MKMVTFKGQPIQISGTGPSAGSTSPALQGVDLHLKNRSLSEFQGKKKIICFVPSLDTAVCSTSAQQFNRKIVNKPDVQVIYCSMDLPFALQRICKGGGDSYERIIFLSLFRDPTVAEAFGVTIADGPLAGLCARSVFVLDEKNQVLYRHDVEEIAHEPDYESVLRYV